MTHIARLNCGMLPLLMLSAASCGETASSRGTPASFDLVRDGKPVAVVVCAPDAPLEVRHAASELVAYVRRMSGAEMPVVAQPPQGPAVVLEVDPGLNPPPAGQKAWAGSRGYRWHTEGNRLRIVGSDALSVLYGVYRLLERHLGVRWLWPGDLGEVVPERQDVSLPALDETSVPHFAVRRLGTGDWALRNGANTWVEIAGQPVGVKWKWHFHSFATLIPAEKYYDQHPEWWPLVNGVRERPTRENSHGTQLCTTNPELVAEMTRNLIAVLDAEPDIEIIALSPNDGGGFCQCEKCRALDEPERDWFARYSKRLAVLNNTIAREVAKKHPNVLIKVGAYAMYLRRPLEEELRPTPNQLVQICHIYNCHNHPVEGDHCVAGKTYQPTHNFMPNQEFRQMIADWKKVASHLFVYEYYTLGGPARVGLLWPLVHTMRHDMPYYHRVGIEGFFTQLSANQFHRYGLNYYVAAHLAWDTSQDVDALVEDYCRSAFGPAAEPMLAYFRCLEKAMVDSDLCLSYGLEGPQIWGPKVFTEKVMEEARGHLDRAAALAPEGAYRERVAFFRRGYDEAVQALATMRPRQ